MTAAARTVIVDCAVAGRTYSGEIESGDLLVMAPFPDGVLLAAIDGLGHGTEAAMAARTAAEALERRALDPVVLLMQQCHQALRKTRGAVMSLASFDAGRNTLSWLGVGNVEGILFRQDPDARPNCEHLLLRGGVVGYQMPPLRAATLPIVPGDTLVFATDGLRGSFTQTSPIGRPPQNVADELLARYATGNDDALVIVVRYLGRGS